MNMGDCNIDTIERYGMEKIYEVREKHASGSE